MTYPLRAIRKRDRNGGEVLECGHLHQGSRRPAQRRRCSACGVLPPGAVVVEESRIVYSGQVVARCGYCFEDVREDEPIARCSCGSMLHPECRKELGRCPTLGCFDAAKTAIRPVVAVRPVVIRLASKSFWVRFVAGVVAVMAFLGAVAEIGIEKLWALIDKAFE